MLAEGKVVFAPKVENHHHFIAAETGHIYDIPWEALQVAHMEKLKGFDVQDYQVVMRGRKKSRG